MEGRANFLEFSIAPPSEDVAIFRAQSAMMYAGYHQKVKNLARFDTSAGVAAAVDVDNALVVEVALDHLLWTEHLAHVLEALDENIAKPGKISNRTLGLPGLISEQARAELEQRGWKTKKEVLPR